MRRARAISEITAGVRDTVYRATPVGNRDAVSLEAWGEVFGDVVIASDILDRLLLHHATTVNIKGDSNRLREKRKAGFIKCILTPHSEV